jgi:predicted MPP superfamily phosphohydrolase
VKLIFAYRGTYLTDITFIEDGNPDYIKGLINFRKRELVYLVIREVQQYQLQRYNYEYVDNIAHFLAELPYHTDEELYELSLVHEPRNVASADELP